MSNKPTGSASNVIVGPARMLIAPTGSTLPTLDGTVEPVVWDPAWIEVGYTEDGTKLAYQPTLKEIMVDEEPAPVKRSLDTEKATISANVAESTLVNLNAAISASTLTSQAADATHAQTKTLKVGGGSLTEVMVGLEGLSPTGRQRIIIGYRAQAQANIQLQFKRNDKTIIPVELSLLADSTKPSGENLFEVVDFLAAHS